VDRVPHPLLLRKSGSAGNRTRDLWICFYHEMIFFFNFTYRFFAYPIKCLVYPRRYTYRRLKTISVQSRTPWEGDQPVARPLPTHRTGKAQTSCLERDSNPRPQCLSTSGCWLFILSLLIVSSVTVGVWRSLRITVFGMYQGASTIMRKAFDWKRSRISMLEVEAVPHSCIPVQIGLSIVLYIRSLLLVESLSDLTVNLMELPDNRRL
jgi:hypothetical protein